MFYLLKMFLPDTIPYASWEVIFFQIVCLWSRRIASKALFCLFCLDEGHNVSACLVCQWLSPKAHTDRASHLKAALWKKTLSSSVLAKLSPSPGPLVTVPPLAPTTQDGSGPPLVCSIPVVLTWYDWLTSQTHCLCHLQVWKGLFSHDFWLFKES